MKLLENAQKILPLLLVLIASMALFAYSTTEKEEASEPATTEVQQEVPAEAL